MQSPWSSKRRPRHRRTARNTLSMKYMESVFRATIGALAGA